jgi:iron(III) transport system substrate-binding protein
MKVTEMNKTVVVILSAMLVLFSSGVPAQTPDWKKNWDETLAAAKKEGKVVVTGPPDAQVRKILPAAFKARYGITLEYIGGRSSELAAKLRSERSAGAGLYTVDVMIGGAQTMSTILYAEKMIDPIKPILILPEVVDGSKWKKGKVDFLDPEQQYVLRIVNTITPFVHINTQEVKPNEIRHSKDLLDPKWRGKLAFMDPTVPGTGSNTAAHMAAILGEDFLKRLYIDQKPMITRDTRQLTDWLARGNPPIVAGAEDEPVEKLRKDGLPLHAVYELSDLPATVTGGFGLVALLKNAPHPNAAKVFVNWIASKEGQETFGRALGVAPVRTDIDATTFLPREMVPRSDVNYFDTYDWEFTVTKKEKVRLYMKSLLGR